MSILDNIGNLDVTKSANIGPRVSKIDPATIPGFIPAAKGNFDPARWRVRYQRLDIQEPSDIVELETIENKAIRNRGIYVLSKERFVFMDKILMLIQYLEETSN